MQNETAVCEVTTPPDVKAPGTSRRWALTLGAIFGLAFLVRLLCLLGFQQVPFFESLIVDSKKFDLWAQHILLHKSSPPGAFFQAPLYPYFLALCYGAFGHNLLLTRLVQIAIGSAGCVALTEAGRRFFSKRAGILAGILLSLFAPSVFSDTLIQKTVLETAFLSFALLIASIFLSRGGLGLALVWGVVLGGLTLTRENALVLLPLCVFWVLWAKRASSRPSLSRRLGAVAALLLGFSILVTPAYLHNARFGARSGIATFNMGSNFYIGNSRLANGSYVPLSEDQGTPEYEERDVRQLAEKALGHRLSPDQVSAYWLHRGLADVQADPAGWMQLLGRKLLLSMNHVELIDADDIYFYEQSSLLLRLLNSLLNFGILLPLGAAGIVLARRRGRAALLLLVFLAALHAGPVAFYVVARYRVIEAPLLALFAAYGLLVARRAIGFKRYRPLALPGLGVLATAAIAFLPLISKDAQLATSYFNAAGVWHEKGSLAQAAACYQKALELGRRQTAGFMNLGNTLYEMHDFRAAREQYLEALKITKDPGRARLNLGNTFLAEANTTEALTQYALAEQAHPGSAEVQNAIGVALLKQRRYPEAEKRFLQALNLQPDYPAAKRNLAQLRAHE